MRKRLLSWLLVLTMVVSLIPSTLVTTAFAADNTSAQASGQAGKTTVKLTNDWPTDLSADITDVTVTNTIGPGSTLTVGSGKTLIFHGSGFISGGTANQTLVIVEKGGHLVLDDVTIQNNAVGRDGAIYVKKGGLLDLGYNDQSERRAPSITNNKSNSAAKNLVIEDGATVRLNAAADKAIGVSYYKSRIDVGPFIAISGGRYTMRGTQEGNINNEAITSDDTTKWKLSYSYDNLIMTNKRSRVLVWDVTDFWSYEGTPNHRNKVYNTIQNVDSKGYDVTLIRGNKNSPRHLTAEEMANLQQYDLIVFDCPNVDINNDERAAYLNYLNNGGRILFSVENAMSKGILRDTMNSTASKIAQALGGQFTAHAGEYVVGGTRGTTHTSPERVKALTKNMSTSWDVNVGAYITSTSQKVYSLVTAKTNKGNTSKVICDQDAGDRDGSQWGALTIIGDVDIFYYSYNNGGNTGGNFIKNLVENTVTRRISAAAGVNPNKEIKPQATTTTTTETKEYSTPYAALQKATETNTVTLLTNSNAALTPTRDELLFENAKLAYEANSQYAGSTIYADTAGVYVDITKTGEVNLRSGTVTVTPKDKNYVLTMNGTMDDAGTQITGGYQIKSADEYTLTVEDSTSPISAENGGTASVKASKVGQVFTVVEPGGETVTYTAKEKDEVIYLGRYRVVYAQDSTAQYTPSPKPTYASTFSQRFTPMTGYEMKGGSFRVALWDETAKDWKEINIEASDADSIAGEKTVWKSADGKVSVEQSYSKTGLSTGVTVTVNDVKQDIKIYTTDKAMVETNPNITLRGVGTDKTGQKLTDPLYELPTTMSYKDGKTTKPIESIPWEKYKLTGVMVGLSDDALVEQDLTDANGNKDADEALKTYTMLDLTKGSNIIVEFQYEWNWVDVSVKAVLSDGVTPFPGFVPEIVEMEADKTGTVKAPNISGYEPDATSKEVTPSKTNADQNVVTFKYTQAMSKVIYKAVDKQGNEMGTFDGPTIANGETPSLASALAPKLTGYRVEGNGVASSDQPFDGTNPITVTFTYVPRVKTVKVYMYEYDASKSDFKGASLKFDETSYASMTTGQTLTISAPPIAGYTVKEDAGNDELRKSKSVFVKDDDTEQSVNFFYVKDTATQKYVTVKLMDTSKTPNALIFSYKIPGIAGQAQVVSAPTTLDGYVADGTNADVTIRPDEDKGAGEGVVVFKFKPDVWTVTVKLMDNSTDPATEIATKPTNFQDTYTVTKGKEISITAPSIYGYTLALTGQDNDLNGGTLKFTPTSNTEKTIYYVPIAQEMVNIQVTGKVDGGNDLYTYTVQAAAGTGTYTIDAKKSIPGYTLAGATIGNDDVLGQITNDKLNVPVPADVKGGTVAVTLTYKSTKTTVTVKTSCDGTDLSTTYPVEKEIGQETSVVAPSIPGYTATEQTKTLTPQGNDVVTFEYTKNTGNVVLIAKVGKTELFRKDGGAKANGDTINAADFKAPDVTYYQRTAADPTITVNSQPFTTGSKYNGIGQIEITYQYERKTASITIVKMDADTRKEINREQVFNGLSVGENHAFTDNLTVTSPSGYTAESGNPTSAFLADSNGAEVVFWYRQNQDSRYVNITVNYLYRGAALSKENVVKAFIGVDNTIDVPTFDGYTAKSYTFNNGASTDITDASKGITVKPTEKTATLTITYERKDGSIVLPGVDGAYPAPDHDKDNVIVTPDDVNKPLVDNGNDGVKVPDDGTATVTRPTDKGKEDITVPGGSVVKPDGTIVLPKDPGSTGGGEEISPDTKIPENLPAGYVAITYDSNNTAKEVKKEIGKKGVLAVKGSLFTDPDGANFVEWNDSGLGSGKPYAAGTTVDASVTLYAKWNAKYTYSATITYKPNGAQGQDVSYIVGHNTDKNLKTTLPSNLYQIPDWTFGGWNEAANGSGTLYQGDTDLNLTSGDTKELFAQWFKVNADGSITVPGDDSTPNTNRDTTANGNGQENPKRDDATGNIEVPKGGSVTLPGGSVIGMPDGGILKPDGTVVINRPDKDGNSKTDDGTITIPGKADPSKPDVTDKGGQTDSNAKVITLVYKNNNQNNEADVEVKVVKGDTVKIIENPFVWTGYTFTGWVSTDKKPYTPGTSYDTTNATDEVWMFAHWVKENQDGSVELPGKDGNLDGPGNEKDDNVIVSPDNGGNITPNPDGSVKVENNGGTVNRPKDPDHPNNGREDIKVPEGTVVEPDGTIKLPQKPDGSDGGEIKPGTNLPDATPEGYISVVYKANGGTGDDVIVLVKRDESIKAIANPFTNGSQSFTGWNTADNGSGGTSYNVGDTITVAADARGTTLFAQWGKAAFNHTAKITYLPNDGSANKDEETVGSNTSTTFSANLKTNPFTVNGWTFGGWNNRANGTGTLKAANAVVEVEAGKDQTWFAQWYKVNANDSITVPGDGNPNTADDNVTANGNGKGNNPTRDNTTGNIEIPAGGSVITPNGEITLPDGGILKPDGTVIINLPDTNNNGKPDNTITVPGANGTDPDVKDENGNTDNTKTAVVLTYQANNGSGKEVKVYTVSGKATQALAKDTFTYSGHKFLYWQSGDKTYQAAAEITPNGNMILSAVWAKVNPDGSIELPGKDGKLDGNNGEEKDNVIVTPDSKDGLEGPKDDGSVEVKPDHEATVTRPDPDPTKPDTKEDVKVPAGTVILPDGTIKLPAPDNTEIKPGDKIPETTTAYVTVTFEAGTGTGSTIKQIVNQNSKITLLDESVFTAPDNHFFVGWKDADGKSYDAGVKYDVGTAAVTFTAQYQDRDNLTKAVAIFDYAGGTDANGNGSKYVTGKADAAITGIADPTRTGYTFAGWGNADLKFGASGSVTEFTAQWTIKSYDVTFEVGDNNKGTMSGYTDPVTVEYGKSVPSADIPRIAASAGNVFVGWLNSSDNSVYTTDSLKNYVVTGNVTFTAQYVDASLATVIFVYAGGTLNGEYSKLVSATEGSAIGTLPEPTRDGYTLTGWTPTIADNATFGAAGTVTVYTAQWDENEKQPFTVTFEIDAVKGSTADDTTETVADGGFVTKVPTVTANAGYRFVGWMDQDKKLFYEAGLLLYPITKNTTFTAQFEEVTANPGTATVIFDANGGKIGNNSVLTKVGVPGAQVENIANPVRAGYTFVSWLDEQGDAVDAANIVYGAADTTATYTAKWEAIEYTIHFSATGASGATADQTYKFDGTTKNSLNRNGFTLAGKDFIGWSLTDGATSADFADGALINDTLRAALAASNGSITLYAVWADGVTNTLTVTGSKATAKRDETVDFTAYLNGVATNAVTWIVTGGQSGTHIDANGVLTIGSNESNGTVLTVTAIYKNDTSLTANATVRVVVNSNNNGGNNGGGTVSSSFVIKASAGNGGIISPSGNVSVKRGDDQAFVINPVNGYRIADVIVDGKSVDAVSLYTFENVRANHTIEVVFTKLNSIVADPTETGVAGWLQTREHIAYLGGYGNGLFGPNDNMTRAQVAQMFYNLLLEKDIPVTTSFSDVPADAWYAKAVNTLASLGIIKGIGNDQFAPNRTITRAEFTVIAMRFANVSATVTNPFSDIASSDWYYTAVTSAVSYGWITGYSDGTFKPMATITRAEVATIVNRMLARTADRNFVDSSAVTRFDDVPTTYWAYYNIAEATTAHTHTIDNDGVESWGRRM